jgi:hypothetical protein
MNILKVFDKAVMKQKIITEYLDHVESEDAYGTVKLYLGDSVWFRCVFSGKMYEVLEFHQHTGQVRVEGLDGYPAWLSLDYRGTNEYEVVWNGEG